MHTCIHTYIHTYILIVFVNFAGVKCQSLSHVQLFATPWTMWGDPHDPNGQSHGSSVHGILQAKILEWVAIPFSREFSWPRDWNSVSHRGRFFTIRVTREAPCWSNGDLKKKKKKNFVTLFQSYVFFFCLKGTWAMEAVCILDLLLSWPGENTKSIGMNKQWVLRLCLKWCVTYMLTFLLAKASPDE